MAPVEDSHREDIKHSTPNGPELLFITGRGRSGTDLLKSMLNSHPKISVAPESLFIMNLYQKYKNRRWTPHNLQQFYKDLWLETRMKSWWDIDTSILHEELSTTKPVDPYNTVCKKVYRAFARSHEEDLDHLVFLGDKNPTYTLFLSRLRILFPNSLFIHMVRDFRDNILSFQSVQFDQASTPALAERWRTYNRNFIRFQRTHSPVTFCLRFEDLLQHPRTQLKKLCDFLSISYTNEMLRFYKTDQELEQWQKNLNNPLDQTKAYKWKRIMNEKDQIKAEFVCGETGKLFGYQSKARSRPFSPLFYLQVLLGHLASTFEVLLFYFPLRLRSWILHKYRVLMGHD